MMMIMIIQFNLNKIFTYFHAELNSDQLQIKYEYRAVAMRQHMTKYREIIIRNGCNY